MSKLSDKYLKRLQRGDRQAVGLCEEPRNEGVLGGGASTTAPTGAQPRDGSLIEKPQTHNNNTMRQSRHLVQRRLQLRALVPPT